MSRFIGDPRQPLHWLETPDHLQHDKTNPRGEQRYDTPVKMEYTALRLCDLRVSWVVTLRLAG